MRKYEILSQSDTSIALMAVPMHWSRYIIRGFDHMDLLASGLARENGITKIQALRAHFTRRQSKLSKSKRFINRQSSFTLKAGVFLPKTIILIDDIVSTGATVNACAHILKDAGVERVYVIAIASNQ